MNFHKYFLAVFAAAALSADPMVGIAGGDSDQRNHTSADVYEERQGEEMITEQDQEGWQSDESLAQLPEESEEPLPSGYCLTETVIDESTGEVIALHEVCEQMDLA